jgi:hypothetical protein
LTKVQFDAPALGESDGVAASGFVFRSDKLITGRAPSEFAPARFHQLTISIGLSKFGSVTASSNPLKRSIGTGELAAVKDLETCVMLSVERGDDVPDHLLLPRPWGC